MSEEPKQETRDAQGNEEKDNLWGKFKELFFANPTLFLTLLYIYATGIGILYSWVLYGRFGINIFEYSEISDFLLAAFKNRAVLQNLVGQGTLLVAILTVSASSPTFSRRFITRRPNRLVLLGYVYIGLVALTVYVAAAGTASTIKAGDHPGVDVRHRSFSGTAGQVTENDLTLIGATQKMVFFYDADENNARTLVIPQAQIVSIEVPE